MKLQLVNNREPHLAEDDKNPKSAKAPKTIVGCRSIIPTKGIERYPFKTTYCE